MATTPKTSKAKALKTKAAPVAKGPLVEGVATMRIRVAALLGDEP